MGQAGRLPPRPAVAPCLPERRDAARQRRHTRLGDPGTPGSPASRARARSSVEREGARASVTRRTRSPRPDGKHVIVADFWKPGRVVIFDPATRRPALAIRRGRRAEGDARPPVARARTPGHGRHPRRRRPAPPGGGDRPRLEEDHLAVRRHRHAGVTSPATFSIPTASTSTSSATGSGRPRLRSRDGLPCRGRADSPRQDRLRGLDDLTVDAAPQGAYFEESPLPHHGSEVALALNGSACMRRPGSLAWRRMREAPVPKGPGMRFKHVLVPIDLSDRNTRLLGTALALAEASAARVTLLHVIQRIAHVRASELRGFYARLERASARKLDRQPGPSSRSASRSGRSYGSATRPGIRAAGAPAAGGSRGHGLTPGESGTAPGRDSGRRATRSPLPASARSSS